MTSPTPSIQVLAILQARMSSTRLPGKVLQPILGRPLLALQLERVARSRCIDQVMIATSEDASDDPLEALGRELGLLVHRGNLHDVLDRYTQAARRVRPATVVRLTGDCPLLDPAVIDEVIGFYADGAYDYASNTIEPTYPDGLDCEVFKFAALERAWLEAKLPSEREHVTPFLKKHPELFRLGSYKSPVDHSALRWTVDEPEDFAFVRRVYEALYPVDPAFTTDDVLALLAREPGLAAINAGNIRDAGYLKSVANDAKKN
jgi:spore coat polysaccharide biosynthesis protein SpsF